MACRFLSSVACPSERGKATRSAEHDIAVRYAQVEEARKSLCEGIQESKKGMGKHGGSEHDRKLKTGRVSVV
eukprot:scaffold72194_cov14-Tisochrysis_lutea.AAC.2